MSAVLGLALAAIAVGGLVLLLVQHLEGPHA